MKSIIIFKSVLLTIFCTLFIISCSTKREPEQGVGTPQLSQDDKTIYFIYFDGTNGSICKMSIADSEFEQISPITNKFTFYNPRLTKNEKKIVFVGRENGTNLGQVFISNIDGSSIQSLFTSEYVYKAFLSKNKNEIIYSKPDTIANYSPIARKSAHGYDIFSFDLESKKTNKLTNFHSYSIDGISDYKKDSLLYTDEDVEGICAIARNNTSKPRIIIKNNSTDNIQHQFNYPIFIERYNVIVFQDSYQLYQIKGNNQIKLIYQSDKMISSFCTFNTLPRLLFTLEGECCFYSINLDGTDLKKKEIQLSSKNKQVK